MYNNSYRFRQSTDDWETGFTILFGGIGILLALFGVYEIIVAAQSLVPPGEYQGLIKLLVTLVMICVCGGIFFLATVLLTSVFAGLGHIVGSLVGDLWNKTFH
jgi:hypothetical protein